MNHRRDLIRDIASAAAFCCVFGMLWQTRAQHLKREAELRTELKTVAARWAVVSAQQEDATAARERFEAVTDLQARLSAESTAPRWTPLLKAIIESHTAETELKQITARLKPDAPD